MTADPREVLRRWFGFDDFRGAQRRIVDRLVGSADGGDHALVLMPTGGGKSLCYQVPALCLDGGTLVVSPLIALMQDQVDALRRRDIPATFINSTVSREEREARLEGFVAGQYKLLYVTPERFRKPEFVELIRRARIALLAVDVHVHDTAFVVAHFHYIMVGGAVSGFFGALHFWWPKITGRMYSLTWGRICASLIFFGFNLTFFPQFILGYLGMERRYYSYPPEFQVWNIFSSAGASVLAIGYALPFFYLGWSLFRGKRAGSNPWAATGLEWQTSSPPPAHNFDKTPTVTRPPYQYRPEPEPQDV